VDQFIIMCQTHCHRRYYPDKTTMGSAWFARELGI